MRMGVASPSNYFWLRSSSALDFKRVGTSEEMAAINDLPDVSNRHTKTSENVDHDGRQNYGASYELHRAAFHGDLARVEELLTAKLDLSTQDKHGAWLKCLQRGGGVCVAVTVYTVQLTSVFI